MTAQNEGNPNDIISANLLVLIDELSTELHPQKPSNQPTTLDSSLDRDLGLDSLARLELLARVERTFGVTAPERSFADANTPRDLLRVIANAQKSKKRIHLPKAKPVKLDDAVEAPHTAQTLVEVLSWHVHHHPDRPHVQFYNDEGRRDVLTYRDLYENAKMTAAGLQYNSCSNKYNSHT